MSQRLRAIVLACCLVVVSPVWAVGSGLQVSLSGWSGRTVTVLVHNTTSSTVSARVSIGVVLADGTSTTLTSASFSVAAGTTSSVAISAPQTLLAIDDNPEPIGIFQ